LDHHELYDDYSALGQELHFEQTTYERFGRTSADREEFARHARPLIERMKAIEDIAASDFRSWFLRLEQVGFGVRAPLSEPIRYVPIGSTSPTSLSLPRISRTGSS
jgi:hypothetical protein